MVFLKGTFLSRFRPKSSLYFRLAQFWTKIFQDPINATSSYKFLQVCWRIYKLIRVLLSFFQILEALESFYQCSIKIVFKYYVNAFGGRVCQTLSSNNQEINNTIHSNEIMQLSPLPPWVPPLWGWVVKWMRTLEDLSIWVQKKQQDTRKAVP